MTASSAKRTAVRGKRDTRLDGLRAEERELRMYPGPQDVSACAEVPPPDARWISCREDPTVGGSEHRTLPLAGAGPHDVQMDRVHALKNEGIQERRQERMKASPQRLALCVSMSTA